jgi:hypothetical protein
MNKRTWRQVIALVSAAVLVVSMCATGLAQQGVQEAKGKKELKVEVAGENPAIRKLDKEGGTAVSSANFWRVYWSPVGRGAICYLDVKREGNKNLRIAIYDNKEVYDYVTNKLMSSLLKTFNTPPFKELIGTIARSGDGKKEIRETCRSDEYTVELIWTDISDTGNWSDNDFFGVQMSFVMVPAGRGEILINGESAPGTWYPTGGGMGTGAYFTFNETWRR